MSEKEHECFQNGLYLRFLRESWEVDDFTDVTLVADHGRHIEQARIVLSITEDDTFQAQPNDAVVQTKIDPVYLNVYHP